MKIEEGRKRRQHQTERGKLKWKIGRGRKAGDENQPEGRKWRII